MLNKGKKAKLLSAMKSYSKKFLSGNLTELDESGTRLMVNSFLTDVLGYTPIEDVKTEYMIRGTYADYVIQINGTQHFLVEVKALSLQLSDKHLRQATNYGANEGIDYVLLTNGKSFDFYKVIFNKPIEVRKVFSIDLSDSENIKNGLEFLEFLHKDSVLHKGLDLLWSKTMALDPEYISGYLYDPSITNFIKRCLKKKFKARFTDAEIHHSIDRIISESIPLEKVKIVKVRKSNRKKNAVEELATNCSEANVSPSLESIQ